MPPSASLRDSEAWNHVFIADSDLHPATLSRLRGARFLGKATAPNHQLMCGPTGEEIGPTMIGLGLYPGARATGILFRATREAIVRFLADHHTELPLGWWTSSVIDVELENGKRRQAVAVVATQRACMEGGSPSTWDAIQCLRWRTFYGLEDNESDSTRHFVHEAFQNRRGDLAMVQDFLASAASTSGRKPIPLWDGFATVPMDEWDLVVPLETLVLVGNADEIVRLSSHVPLDRLDTLLKAAGYQLLMSWLDGRSRFCAIHAILTPWEEF